MEYLIEQLKIPIDEFISIEDSLKKLFGKQYLNIKTFNIIKKSIDARDKASIKLVFSLKIKSHKKILPQKANNAKITRFVPEPTPYLTKKRIRNSRPVVVGLGPSGIFCALRLLDYGITPIIIERGKKIEERKSDVQSLWSSGLLDTESNPLFGEGGAGTYSDGKLTTQINNPFNNYILEKLVFFGAPSDILYEAKPHIGTDKLQIILKNIRNHLIEKGVTIHYSSVFSALLTNQSVVQGIIINDILELKTEVVFLGIGHSAHDTYKNLYNSGIEMEPKPFALGFRIEHSQEAINKIQYGEKYKNHHLLGSSPYKLTFKSSQGRQVYSFCMCPGGQIICASNQKNRLVINGMSSHARNSGSANSAIVVNIQPDDFYQSSPMDGLAFIQHFEQKAYDLGQKPFFAPAQKLRDFLINRTTKTALTTTYRPGNTPTNLHNIYPSFVNTALIDAFHYFDKVMTGFVSDEAVLLGVETRTSSPVRFPRGKDGQHTMIKGLYPIGEGAGYAGGIMSAALDGIKAVESLIASET
ncbi:MAG: hypothetical protein DKM50_12620 [Candidatus Margulisiibacteriota bacterium]|nr:MAG: hypothetical protein A2X43_11080 [Candidatus Margulisbacteria bacterium GWD2_39_127]OGI02772.1 MAG: hypothetical protein A2X42_01905 [Candidatus Margulisbacteria bacterium GWF2_38_17]OGI09341.1 MAG: hypothetical protein A2X41_09470 [Candidatus Margulisbacteria bacterium GWE2_39_32]PZM77445.1 MAG: hypothetical protein DKM50_12620 [Candidatus Margulisiibacteriota bacterium]HAR63992.1 hypothetical protein [Candidatus Margulisiibacteriota bacterium]